MILFCAWSLTVQIKPILGTNLELSLEALQLKRFAPSRKNNALHTCESENNLYPNSNQCLKIEPNLKPEFKNKIKKMKWEMKKPNEMREIRNCLDKKKDWVSPNDCVCLAHSVVFYHQPVSTSLIFLEEIQRAGRHKRWADETMRSKREEGHLKARFVESQAGDSACFSRGASRMWHINQSRE